MIQNQATVLVGVLKSKRDLGILLREGWYRIPKRHMPTRPFQYLAWYEPKSIGRTGKQIRYYAPVIEKRVMRRIEVLPHDVTHPQKDKPYVLLKVGTIQKLISPIKNNHPRRISFGFTTLERLRCAKTILELYEVTPTEELLQDALKKVGIAAIPQKVITYGKKGSKKRYCLDFAVICKRGNIAIECDNKKAHSTSYQRQKDKKKDAWLHRHGWKVIRITESDIVKNVSRTVARITRDIQKLGNTFD